MEKDRIDIRWHGRGGQGAITAAKIAANAAFASGYEGVVMVPTFGTERRGAPVFTSLKISKKKIYDLSPIETPDIIVILDHTLLEETDVTSGLKKGGILIINSPKSPASHSLDGVRTAVCDVAVHALASGLPAGVVNSGIIGAFSKASGILDIDTLARAVEEEFRGKKPAQNAESARRVYAQTCIGG